MIRLYLKIIITTIIIYSEFNIVIITIINMLVFWEFFTSALAEGFPLESEWQQVSTCLQDSS